MRIILKFLSLVPSSKIEFSNKILKGFYQVPGMVDDIVIIMLFHSRNAIIGMSHNGELSSVFQKGNVGSIPFGWHLADGLPYSQS
jgi:hypothetical protein